MTTHEPSTLALDVYWASGRTPVTAIEAHLATCLRCRTYLDGLDAAAEAARSERRASPARARSVATVVGLVALAAGVAVFLRTRPPADGGYVGIKGTPGAQVLVHRGSATRVWDGQSPLWPGDALALRVSCGRAQRVAVASPIGATWQLLAQQPCRAPGDVLPLTLVVDGAPGDERLAVVLSRDVLDPGAVREALADIRQTADVWVVPFVLPKEIAR